MSQLPQLRRELVAAAAREYAPAAASAPVASRRRWHPVLRALPAVVAVLVVLAVAAGALLLIHHRSAARHPAGAGAVPGRQALIDELGVLRRPQTKRDRSVLGRFRSDPLIGLFGSVDASLVRYATTTSWGERVYLVAFTPVTAAQHAATVRQGFAPAGPLDADSRLERVGVFSPSRGGGGGQAAAQIRMTGSVVTQGAGRGFAGGSSATRVIALVPDGVARVQFVLPRQPYGSQHGGKVYPTALRVTVPVRGNIAAVQVDRQTAGEIPMVWLAADGHVIRQVGNVAGASRVVATQQPAPQTARSRAAQRDPAAPNRVWVTPTTGGPHTQFHLHFRILLNGADYRYRFTGARCPSFTFRGGSGNPNALRGSLWDDVVGAISDQALCRGTYHVAVSVGFGAARAARRFGSATFTVR